jgi:hypothetical protein
MLRDTFPDTPSPEEDPLAALALPKLNAKRQHARVEPIASEKRHTERIRSRAVAAIAPLSMNKGKTKNYDASSGKCVRVECASRVPAAYVMYKQNISLRCE